MLEVKKLCKKFDDNVVLQNENPDSIAVKYDDLFLTDNNIVENDYFAWPEVPSYNFPGTSFVGAYGYEGNDKLYNKLVRSQSGDYIIEASDGLYVES